MDKEKQTKQANKLCEMKNEIKENKKKSNFAHKKDFFDVFLLFLLVVKLQSGYCGIVK